MLYRFHGLTDLGSVRTNNEDALAIDPAHGMVILADGMGGYNAGEIASRMATEFISTELVRWLTNANHKKDLQRVARAIEMCADEANLAILDAAESNPHYTGMGTTLVVAVFQEQHLVLAHVGDSRCYRLRGGQLQQITKDHSILQERVDAGLMTPEQAAVAPGRNLLTRALGVDASTHVDIQEQAVQDADLYLICSDGLSDMVPEAELHAILSNLIDMPTTTRELIDRANANGGRDNITAILVQAIQLRDTPPTTPAHFLS